MFYIIEILIALFITYIFIKREKPKITFLLYGYIFILISLMLQIPIRLIEINLENYFTNIYLPTFLILILTTIISETTKYLSLKKFLKTKSFKNAILFGIGWSTIQSINFLTTLFYSTIFSILSINFNYLPLLNPQLNFLNFIFLFIFNLAITVLVIFSVIKKKIIYLLYAILFSISIPILLSITEDFENILVSSITFIYSLFIIFKYRKLK